MLSLPADLSAARTVMGMTPHHLRPIVMETLPTSPAVLSYGALTPTAVVCRVVMMRMACVQAMALAKMTGIGQMPRRSVAEISAMTHVVVHVMSLVTGTLRRAGGMMRTLVTVTGLGGRIARGLVVPLASGE